MTANASPKQVRVRFAPSPTGFLHIGGARTALYNWFFARKHGGVFALRIEDTDQERSTQAAVDQILDALTWLGLNWDEGPVIQTQQTAKHQAALDKLEANGSAYRSYATTEEVDAFRAVDGQSFVFKRSKHEPNAAETQRRRDAGAPYVLRLDIGEEGSIDFVDHVRGAMSFQRAVLADLVLARQDGGMLYNFVCPIDDIDMRITHVIRGEDHLTNTARQIAVFQAMGEPAPEYAHLSLILGPDKQRFSKRHGATSVQQFREEGYLPDALVNFLALLGWSPPATEQEIFSPAELASLFSLDRVNKAAAVFDIAKLDAFNGIYLREKTPRDEVKRMAREAMRKAGLLDTPVGKSKEQAWLDAIIELEIERSRVLTDFPKNLAYFFEAPTEFDEKGVKKFIARDGGRALMQDAIEVVETSEPFDAATLESGLRSKGEARGENFTKVAQPVRIALTGRTASPPLFDILILLGREESARRLRAAMEKLATA